MDIGTLQHAKHCTLWRHGTIVQHDRDKVQQDSYHMHFAKAERYTHMS